MKIRFALALFLAAALGFIALSYEILWTRAYSFVSASRAQAFGSMLGFYLFGLAAGSLLSRKWQKSAENKSNLLSLSRLIVVSNIPAFLLVPALAWLIAYTNWVRLVPLVMVGSAVLGILLPLLCHFAIAPDERAGARMSYIYLANIIGSGAGSLLTGFVLMDVMKLWQISMALMLAGVGIAAYLAWQSRGARLFDWVFCGAAAVLGLCAPLLHDSLYERMQYANEFKPGMKFAQTVESRHGVVTITTNKQVYGGGAYDGVLKTSVHQGEGLIRPYFIPALHPHPREVLVIGLSAGAWTQIIAHNPEVERVTVVEISSAYIDIIRAWPEVSSLLTNKKVNIVIDDGRRWLRRNPDRKFDAIVMNTTFYWREFVSALLSKDFLEMARGHLNTNGFVMWNCTYSSRAARTGMEVFPHTIMVHNNCVGSRSPLNIDKERWRAALEAYRIDGQFVFDRSTPEGQKNFDQIMAFATHTEQSSPKWRVMPRAEMEEKWGKTAVITDDNLGEEYRVTFETFAASMVPGLKGLLYGGVAR
jgi:spermidine synthase